VLTFVARGRKVRAALANATKLAISASATFADTTSSASVGAATTTTLRR
jgi:hypothetical protein